MRGCFFCFVLFFVFLFVKVILSKIGNKETVEKNNAMADDV